MGSIAVGLAGLVVGTLVAAYGTRGFYVLLPLWAAVVGFLLGAELVTELLGEGFLATALGWVAGVAVGAAGAVLAGLFYYVAVVILAASVGYGIGSGLLIALGLEPGLVTLLAGAGAGMVIAVAAILIDAPTLLVGALTAFGGAAMGVAGAWLLLGQVALSDIDDRGPLGALRGDPVAVILWVAAGTAAFGWQWLEGRPVGSGRVAGSAG